MTTLPQTTPLRLPRPTGPAPLALPPGAGPAPYGASGVQLSPADIWRILRSNLWLILGLLVVAGGVGYGVNEYLSRYHSRYTASGLIQIQPLASINPLRGADRPDSSFIPADQSTQVQLLKQEYLFSKVLQNPDSEIRKTIWFKEAQSIQQAKQNLLEKFAVRAVPETRLIVVQMSYRIPRECKVILEEVVNQHLEDQQKILRDKQYDRSVILNNMKIRYQMRLKDLSEEIRSKAVQLSIDGMGISGRGTTKELELNELTKSQSLMQTQLAGVKSAYDTLMEQLSRGVDPPRIEQIVSADEQVRGFRNYLEELEMAMSDASTKFGPKHPSVIQLQQRIDLYQQRLERRLAELRAQTRTELIDAYRGQLSDAQQTFDNLNTRVDAIRQEIGDLSNAMANYLTLQDEQRAMRELLKQVDDQLDDINQMQNQAALSTVSWVTRPQTPDTPSFPKLTATLSIALGLAFALGLGIAFLRELTDTTVRSPRDVAKVGQMNLLGIIPHDSDDPQSAGARLPLAIFEVPQSMIAEQFRQVRTRLQHAASLDTTRSILVTSPSPGDGKSTVACNLAAGLALIGRQILLVDANFRRPELHKTFAVENEQGFSSVLNALDLFDQAVQPTPIPNLAILPIGPRPTNPTELLESQLLIDFIERALEEYDHVIFDSGALLFTSESVAMAPRVDGVVSVVRARSNTRGVLQRMRDALKQIKAEHLGVVLNGVRAHGGGYYGRNIKTYYAYQNGYSR